MKDHQSQQRSGFSLGDLLIVVVTIVLFAVLAVPGLILSCVLVHTPRRPDKRKSQ